MVVREFGEDILKGKKVNRTQQTLPLKVVLHAAIFRAASLATPLRDMLHESLQRVTPLATVKIDAKLAATNVAESRIGFYFSQRLQQLFLALQRVTLPLQQVSQCCGFKTPVRMRNSLPGKQQRWRMR